MSISPLRAPRAEPGRPVFSNQTDQTMIPHHGPSRPPVNPAARSEAAKAAAFDDVSKQPGAGSLLGKIWNLPNTLVGLVWGAIGIPFGAAVSVGNNAVQFENHPFTFSAVTLGNTISYSGRMGPEVEQRGVRIGEHERQHTLQGELLGPLYLPSNLIGGIGAFLTQGSWHGSINWNERGPQQNPPKPW